jgi:hypothetical protein
MSSEDSMFAIVGCGTMELNVFNRSRSLLVPLFGGTSAHNTEIKYGLLSLSAANNPFGNQHIHVSSSLTTIRLDQCR